MSQSDGDPKKRPPPICVPPAIPLYGMFPKRTDSISNGPHAQQQYGSQIAPSAPTSCHSAPTASTLQDETPPLPHVVPRSKSRASALNALNAIMDQTRPSPQKMNRASTSGSQPDSTTRSRHSARSHHSAAVAQVPLLMFTGDEKTSRGKIEARNEQKSGKAGGDGEVVIERHDLRPQCKTANSEGCDEPIKSPKKRFLGMTLPPFGRTHATAKPSMTSKAAQVLGEAPRTAPRSNTAKSLPAELTKEDDYARNYDRNTARRHRVATRKSLPQSDRQPPEAKAVQPVPALNASCESMSPRPPTPPAKDTPPDGKSSFRPASPLRRAAASDRLHQAFKVQPDLEPRIQFPIFSLPPSLSKTSGSDDPEKKVDRFSPYTAGEYQNMIVGTPFPFASSAQDEDINEPGAAYNSSPAGERAPATLPFDADNYSEDIPSYDVEEKEHGRVPQSNPDQWSGSAEPISEVSEVETPSKNSRDSHFLRTSAATQKHSRVSSETNNSVHNVGISIMADGQVNNANASPVPVQASSGHGSGSTPDANTDRAMVAMREHRNGEQTDPNLPASSIKPHLLPDQSSSRLSEMLMGMSPQKHGFHADFQPNCPSAVPSPLHHLPGPSTPMQPAQYMHPMTGPGRVGPWIPTPTQKSMDIHFLMVGEHLDVVGKTTWDAIESLRKEMHPLISDKSKQLAASLEGHINEVKMQVDFINEKTDRTTEQGHNIHTKLEELSKFVRNEVMGSLKSQQNKIDAIEQSMQEVQKTVQSIQKLLEQKLSDPEGGQQHPAASPFHNASSTSSPFPPANHRSQPSFAGFYGNMAEPGREGQSPVAHMHDPRNNSHAHDTNEGHVGFGNSYGQQWGPRSGYHARRSKEDRPYLNNSPYQFANAGPYGSNYNSGYSEFEVPTTPSQHYGGNQGSSK